jgi:pyruvate formate lyase activating enzyme
MQRLKSYINEKIPQATKVELLPYHLMGLHKYKKLGINYPLAEVPAMDKAKTEEFHKKYFN